ncbi:MAG: hypothetical protein WDO18_10835 [Acidobacteriota bacterium]
MDRGDKILAVDGKPMNDTKEWSKLVQNQ